MAIGPEENIESLDGEFCPFCHNKSLTLRQAERKVDDYGYLITLSMACQSENCGYYKMDFESEPEKKAYKEDLEVNSEDMLPMEVIVSSQATVKIPRMATFEPSETSNGYLTTVEGLIKRFKKVQEDIRDSADDKSEKKKAKNAVKKLTKVLFGQESVKISLSDKSGVSAFLK